jgi:hypothetical protein
VISLQEMQFRPDLGDKPHEAASLLPFKFGDRVVVDGQHGIEGVVTGFAIYPHTSEIRIEWFANGDAKSAWFAHWRVRSDS